MEMLPGRQSAEEKRAAFESVALPLMKIVYSRALNLTRNADTAADLVQETYLRAFRTFENFQQGTNAKAWLLTILYSVFVNHYRHEKRSPDVVSLKEADRSDAELVAEGRIDSPATLDPKLWASSEVLAALQRVPEALRTVLLMVDVDELSYEEAARALGCPVGTIRSRLSRARRTLYLELQHYARARGFLGGRL